MDSRFGGLSGILGFWLCFVIDSFAQVSRPHIIFLLFLVFFGCALPCYFCPFAPFAAAHIIFALPLFFIAYAMGLAFKKNCFAWIRGEIAGIFYAWESGAKMLKIGKNGLFLW